MSLAKIPKKVGIIGAGTMGAGIAMCFAQKGIEVGNYFLSVFVTKCTTHIRIRKKILLGENFSQIIF